MSQFLSGFMERRLRRGKYTSWAICVSGNDAYELLSALGEYAQANWDRIKEEGEFPSGMAPRAEGALRRLSVGLSERWPPGRYIFERLPFRVEFRRRLAGNRLTRWAENISSRRLCEVLWEVGEFGMRVRLDSNRLVAIAADPRNDPLEWPEARDAIALRRRDALHRIKSIFDDGYARDPYR